MIQTTRFGGNFLNLGWDLPQLIHYLGWDLPQLIHYLGWDLPQLIHLPNLKRKKSVASSIPEISMGV